MRYITEAKKSTKGKATNETAAGAKRASLKQTRAISGIIPE